MDPKWADTEGDVNTTSRAATWRDQRPELARAWMARDEAVFMHQSLSTPCLTTIDRAQGSMIHEVDGTPLLDFHGNSAHQVGHGHPRVIAATIEALQKLPFCPRRYANPAAVELAERLVALAPDELSRVLLTTSGATAMSTALKIARLATGRYKTVSFYESFHGATLDAISIGGERLFRDDMGPLMPGALHVPPPVPAGCPLCDKACANRCLNQLAYLLEQEGDIAAVVAEPMRCTTVDLPPPSYWKAVRDLCDAHGALLIFDEIPIGLGRTGRWFTCEHFEVTPDLLVLGKGLGGGIFPLAAVLAKEHLNIGQDRALGHFTHEKSSVGAAAGIATLSVLEDEQLIARADRIGTQWQHTIRHWDLPPTVVRDVRGLGLLIGVELNPEVVDPEAVLFESLKAGLSFKISGGTVMTLTPPLNVSDEELLRANTILLDAIREGLG